MIEQIDGQDEDSSDSEYDNGDELEGETDNIDDADIDIAANIIDLEEIRTDFEDIDRIVGEDVVLPKQMRCCSHMLNLVAGVDFHKGLPVQVSKLLNSCLKKLRRIWRLTNKSTVAKSICESTFGRMLIQPNDTRWNSLFDAVNCILSLQEKFNTFCSTLNKEISPRAKISQLTSTDWAILSDYTTVMSPIASGLDILQGDKHACLGFILPTLYSMKKHLSASMLNTIHGEKMRDTLVKALDNRFGAIMEMTEENKSLFIATACHPLFKLTWLPEEDCYIVKNWLLSALQSSNQEAANVDVELSSANNKFFVRYARQSTLQPQNNEVERFLGSQDESVDILHEYPNIKTIFIDTNTTLSSSGSIERMFNQASLIFLPKRNRLSAKNFEIAMFLKING